MKKIASHLEALLLGFAQLKGWSRCEVFFRFNLDWGRVMIIFVAPFPEDGGKREGIWGEVMDYLQANLHEEPELGHGINLVLRTPEEIKRGGIHAIPPTYVAARDL